MNYAPLPVVIVDGLLDERVVSWVLFRERPLMPDRDVRVNDCISCRYSENAARVVGLWETIQFKSTCTRLVVLVPLAVMLLVPLEDTLTIRGRVLLAKAGHCLIMPACRHLNALLLSDDVPVTIGLAVNVAVALCQGSSLDERALIDTSEAARHSGGVVAAGDREVGHGVRERVDFRRRAVAAGSIGGLRREVVVLGLLVRAGTLVFLLPIVQRMVLLLKRVEALIYILLVRAVVKLLCSGLAREELKTLLNIHFLADDLVPERVLLAVSSAYHITIKRFYF